LIPYVLRDGVGNEYILRLEIGALATEDDDYVEF